MVEALTIVTAAGVTRGWRSAHRGHSRRRRCSGGARHRRRYPPRPTRSHRLLAGRHRGLVARARPRLVAQSSSKSKRTQGPARRGRHLRDHGGEPLARATAAGQAAVRRPAGRSWRRGPRDATGFTVAFKGVFLEGMEVVLIVITLGASSGHLALASCAAAAAAVIVSAIGYLVARQLSEVPENWLKLAVGIMLTSFGVFWVGEGAGVHWPGSDLMILVLVAVFAADRDAVVLGMRAIGPSREPSPRQQAAVMSGPVDPPRGPKR